MHIYLGADHRGYELKNNVINWLTSRQITFTDFGANFFDAEDDYNDYAKKVTSALLGDHSGDAFGVLLCGSAQGMCMQANRYKGIRAAICHRHTDVVIVGGCLPQPMAPAEIVPDWTWLHGGFSLKSAPSGKSWPPSTMTVVPVM